MSVETAIREDVCFMNAQEGQVYYGLGLEPQPDPSPLEHELLNRAIGKIAMPVGQTSFEQCVELFEDAIDDCPEVLALTTFKTDSRFGNDIGYFRKEAKLNVAGLQEQDAKSLFHFSELARDYWAGVLPKIPATLDAFLTAGFDLQSDLVKVARANLANIERSHPNISKAYFDSVAPGMNSFSFLRILSYDPYDPRLLTGDVARPHYDIGGFTIQAYADAPGFWGNIYSGNDTEHKAYDTVPGEAYMFFGMAHSRMYGRKSPIKPLYHGVDRVTSPGQTLVPRRRAIILFVDPPHIDLKVTPADTSPDLFT